MLVFVSACLYAILGGVAAMFQLALAAGAPWGAVAMGGKWPGRFPPGLRVLSAIQALVIVWFILVVLANADVSFAKVTGVPLLSIWFVVGIGALGCVMNLFKPARLERIVWGPVTVVMLACTLIVALNR